MAINAGENDAVGRDGTADYVGSHPFAMRVYFGDDRIQAYVADDSGNVPAPGVQAVTSATEAALSRNGVDRAGFFRAAQSINSDPRYLLNLASGSSPDEFSGQLLTLAHAAGRSALDPSDELVLDGLKRSVDDAQALGPYEIVRVAVAYLSEAVEDGGPAYGRLLGHVNHLLLNTGCNPRIVSTRRPVDNVGDFAPEGVELWWVKEGSATIVFQVAVHLKDELPPVRFVLNVAKDLTTAADELRLAYRDFVDLYRIDPSMVMEPLDCGATPVASWRGTGRAALLAAEWFDGHELHVFEGSSQLHVWMDQSMAPDHPIPAEASDRIWERIIRMRARCTRITPAGLLPIVTHVNAGDYIVRHDDDGEWTILLIWFRRPAGAMAPGDYIVVAGMMPGAKVLGSTADTSEWWDRPERSVEALCDGLMLAGVEKPQIIDMLRHAYNAVFRKFESSPEQIPYLANLSSGDTDELRRVFGRATRALGDFLNRQA